MSQLSAKERNVATIIREKQIMGLFIRLIIRLFQLVFSAGTIFFSHNKLANSVF
jgi:hypothetical protein